MSLPADGARASNPEGGDQPVFWQPSLAFIKVSIGCMLGSAVIYEIVLYLSAPGQTARALAVGFIVLVATAAWGLLSGGRARAAVRLLAAGVWLHVTVTAFFLGGVAAASVILYPLTILMVGWLIGTRAAVVGAVLTVAVTLGFVLAESAGLMPPPPPTPPVLRWTLDSIVFLFSAVLITYMVRSYRNRLAEVRTLGGDLAARSAELQAREADLNRAQMVAHVGSWTYDMASNKAQLSAEACRILGLPEGSPGSHDAYLKIVHEEDRAAVDRDWQTMRRGGAAYANEHRIHVGDSLRWISLCAELEPGAARAVGTIQDISERRRAERRLRLQEERLRLAMEATHQGWFDLNVQTGDVTVSPEYACLIGHDPGNFSSNLQNWIAGIHPDDRPAMIKAFADCAESGETSQMEYRRRAANGDYIWIHSIGKVVERDAAGKPLRMTGTHADISARRAAEEALRQSERRFRDLLQNARGVAVQGYAPDGTIQYWNEASVELYGYSTAEAVGANLFELIVPPALREAVRGAVAQMAETGQPVPPAEFALKRKDGSSVEVLSSHAVVRMPDRATELFCIDVDLSERKRAEAALAHLNAELETRVARRTADLEIANRELNSFSYTIAHDMRAPVRAINGFSEMVLKSSEGVLDATAVGHLRRVVEGSRRMGHLIDDLLNLARLSRKDMRRRDCDLSELAAAVVELLRAAQPERHVEVVIAPGMRANGDPGLLRAVLENLIGNAWKFTGKTAAPRIEIGVTAGAATEDAQTVYQVHDNGAGFDMQYAHKLFAPFQRLHHISEFDGTGIGLATVKKIIQRHGGRVWVESAVEAGTTVSFTLGA